MKLFKNLKLVGSILDGHKTVGFGIFMILLGLLSPVFKEWSIENPEQAHTLYGLILSAFGSAVVIFRKFRAVFAGPADEALLRDMQVARSQAQAIQAMPIDRVDIGEVSPFIMDQDES